MGVVIQDPQFKEIVSAIKRKFNPKRLFFFGSRSQGTHRSNSDYDFVVVVERNEHSQIENLMKGKELTRHLPVSADLFVYSESEFNDWKEDFNSIPEVAVSTGQEVDLESF